MTAAIITDEYSLPSKGIIYGDVNPTIRLRSMTVADETKRLAPTKTPYKKMCEIIDSCLVDKLPLSSYDMCIQDYQYLIQKLRIVTYGPDYTLNAICPFCGELNEIKLNLEDMPVKTFDESITELFDLDLPSGKHCRFKLQTPRDLDELELEKEDLMSKFPDMADPTYPLTIKMVVDTIDNKHFDGVRWLEQINAMPMKDAAAIIKRAGEIADSFGIDTKVKYTCSNGKCGKETSTTFRYNSKFYRPN